MLTSSRFIRNFEHIFQGPFQDVSRTIYEFFQDFSQLQQNEMALKAPSNAAGVWGRFEPPTGPGQSPGGGPEAKALEAPLIFYFIAPENGLIHIFFLCCSTITHDKVIKVATRCL